MAQAALIFAFFSFFKLIGSLFKLLRLEKNASKCGGVISEVVEREELSKKKIRYTYSVNLDNGTTGTCQEVVERDDKRIFMSGHRFNFYVGEDKLHAVDQVKKQPMTELGILVACIAIVVVCMLLVEAL